MKLKQLTLDAFSRVVTKTRLKEDARQMAKAVLVDGLSNVAVAAQYGVTKQRVALAVSVIERAYRACTASADLVGGNVLVQLELPGCLAVELAYFAEAIQVQGVSLEKSAEATKRAVLALRKATEML